LPIGYSLRRRVIGQSVRMVDEPLVEICAGCGEQFPVDQERLPMKRRGPRPDGAFRYTYLPRIPSDDEFLIHECSQPRKPGVWQLRLNVGTPPEHPEGN
jgi:hypothetical protein